MMTALTVELFESLQGQALTVETAGGDELWVVDAVNRRQPHSQRTDQPFNVYLSAPVGNNRQQGMRRATLPGGAVVEFFAVPIAATRDGVSYELVFN